MEKRLIKNICKVGVAFSKNYIKEKYDIEIDNIIDEFQNLGSSTKDFMLENLPNLAELNSQRQSFKEFKESLRSAIKWLVDDGKKVVVIIDELDRCKPTFAVQTLEIVKHIFDIENIVFLFAVDIQQLSHSISNIYGQGFDSVGYLCRFFDYIAKLPLPDVRTYIKNEIKDTKEIPQITVPSLVDMYERRLFSELIIDFFVDLCGMFDFTLRDLDTILQSYKIMLNHFLGEYRMVGAHMIYIFYLALKYKEPQKFNNIFIESSKYKTYLPNEFRVFAEKNTKNNKWIMATIKAMENGVIMERLSLKPFYDECGDSNVYTGGYLERVEENTAVFGYERSNQTLRDREYITLKINSSVSNILFYPDLVKWNEIKSMTYREYLHKQLEMYNFIDSNIEDK